MTAQCREHLVYNNEEYYLATEPLHPYLVNMKVSFTSPSTACWRGYIGYWLIEDNKLYLTDLKAYIDYNKNVGLDYLFPAKKKVLAEWYSGEIRIPHGEMMEYVHQGYASLYERELFLKIKKGVVADQYEIDNTHLYSNRAGMKARNMDDLIEAVFWGKTKKKESRFRKILEKIGVLLSRK